MGFLCSEGSGRADPILVIPVKAQNPAPDRRPAVDKRAGRPKAPRLRRLPCRRFGLRVGGESRLENDVLRRPVDDRAQKSETPSVLLLRFRRWPRVSRPEGRVPRLADWSAVFESPFLDLTQE